VFAAVDDVSGEAADTKGESSAEVKKSTDENEQNPENKKSAAEFAERVHS
jgi:hypothetical protein